MKLIVETDAGRAALPNHRMLEAMRTADEMQQSMNPKLESDGVAILRDGRRGALYGNEYGDNPSD